MPPSAIEVLSPTHSEWSTFEEPHKTSQITIKSTVPRIETRHAFTIDELLRKRALEAFESPIISYPTSGTDYVDYTFGQLDVYAHRVAEKYRKIIPQRLSSSEPETVVGLLGPSDFDYFISILALAKLGHTVLFLSTRISAAAYTSLLLTTGAKYLLIAPAFQDIAVKIKESCDQLKIHDITSSDSYEFLIRDGPIDTNLCKHLQPEIESKKISWIIHSSGSTGLPKPIYQTHSAALKNYANNLNMRGFITLPLYHAHGVSSVFRAIHAKKQIYIYNAKLPLTSQNLLDTMHKFNIEIFYGVPYALKLLGDSPDGIKALAKLDIVMFGGSACPE